MSVCQVIRPLRACGLALGRWATWPGLGTVPVTMECGVRRPFCSAFVSMLTRISACTAYSYQACDVGTLPNQTYPNGTVPQAAKTSGSTDYGGELSWLPGQRASACTCQSDGTEHPGPHVSVGRSGPEIDIIEAQYGYGPSGALGSASQSMQIAPMDAGYLWNNLSGIVIHDATATNSMATNGTLINTWHGSINQESLSGITITDGVSYGGRGYQTFGFEYKRGYTSDGAYVSWSYNGGQTWTIQANAIEGNSQTEISDRPISMEPMYIILNLGLSYVLRLVSCGDFG